MSTKKKSIKIIIIVLGIIFLFIFSIKYFVDKHSLPVDNIISLIISDQKLMQEIGGYSTYTLYNFRGNFEKQDTVGFTLDINGKKRLATFEGSAIKAAADINGKRKWELDTLSKAKFKEYD